MLRHSSLLRLPSTHSVPRALGPSSSGCSTTTFGQASALGKRCSTSYQAPWCSPKRPTLAEARVKHAVTHAHACHGQVKGGAALLFSFLLVFDLPAISAGVQSLGRSRLSFAYNEIAPKVTDYAEVLYFGWALGLKFLLFSGAGGELFKDRWVGL